MPVVVPSPREIIELVSDARRLDIDRTVVMRTSRIIALMVETEDDAEAKARVHRHAIETGLEEVVVKKGKESYEMTEKGDVYFEIAWLDDLGIDIFAYGH